MADGMILAEGTMLGAPSPGRVRIELRGLRVMARHGVLPAEHDDEQPFIIDVELIADEPGADDLARTISYAEVARRAAREVGGEHVDLIETLAARVADSCLELSGIHALAVRVHKPQAPVGFPVRDVAVTVVRTPGNDGCGHG